MSFVLIQDTIFLIVLVILSVPLGNYIYKVITGRTVFLSRVLVPVENGLYKLMGIINEDEMSPQKYTLSVLLFSIIGLIFVFAIQMLQNFLPLNPENFQAPSWDLAFNTAASFVSNTNWQAYSGELSLSYLTQSVGLGVQNFLSAATGFAVLFALARGFTAARKTTIGSFWKDLIRITLYVLIPLSLLLALILVSQGVVQSLGSYREVITLQDGFVQTVPLGQAASQIAIKQLGTNGGGFFGLNSAFPLENPTALSNLLQLLSILLIPASLCISFGKVVKDSKQGRAIYSVMMILFVAALVILTFSEHYLAPVF